MVMRKKMYQIEITETLQTVVEVEADSMEEAIAQIRKEWREGNIILDADHFVGVEFHAVDAEIEEEKEKYELHTNTCSRYYQYGQ